MNNMTTAYYKTRPPLIVSDTGNSTVATTRPVLAESISPTSGLPSPCTRL